MTKLVVAGVLLSTFALGKFLVDRFFRRNMDRVVSKGVTYDGKTGEVLTCLFCRIQKREADGRIAYEDEDYVAFHTIAPATKLHLLITPRQHIKSVKSLKGEEGAKIVEDMIRVGSKALGSEAEGAKYCFHIPPYNSIDHLHLHAIAEPSTMSFFARGKYNTNSWFCHSAEDVMAGLRREGRRGDCSECRASPCSCEAKKRRKFDPPSSSSSSKL